MISVEAQKCIFPIIKKNQPDDLQKVQPLPEPTGVCPYHLNLEKVVPNLEQQQLTFHMIGDSGSVRDPDSQRKVADLMAQQYHEGGVNRPQFLYHLGDVVYHFGEAGNYRRQFFDPFSNYPGPIFAIAGNHDSDVNPDKQLYCSLEAFKNVFCTDEPKKITFSEGAARLSQIQPNVYWNLICPLAIIIGLHSNVPKFGWISDQQRAWFVKELQAAGLQRPEKAIIVCVHHAPYSADTNHGSSLYMIDFLDRAFAEAGVKPDIVFSGHVHNYQRFNKQYADGTTLPFIVAGAGGFDELHEVATLDDDRFIYEHPLFHDVHLENYCDNEHGFLKITIEKRADHLLLTGRYFVSSSVVMPFDKIVTPLIADRFVVQIA